VDSRYKFSLLTLKGEDDRGKKPARFAFFLSRTEQLKDHQRVFELTKEDFEHLNPNTRTCPVFRTRPDAELTRKIYERVPVLVNEETGENPWSVRFATMFHMSNDSHLFRTREQLESLGYQLTGNIFIKGNDIYLPLYEAKMIWQYDHRFGTYEGVNSRSSTHLPIPTLEQYQDPSFVVQPWYWVNSEEVDSRLNFWKKGWLLGFRDITNATNERTAIFIIMPRVAISNKVPLWYFEEKIKATFIACLFAETCSISFDFIVRQKIGGTSMNFFYVKQFPTHPQCKYKDFIFLIPRIVELAYSAWDIKPFADNVWNDSDKRLREAIRRQWEDNQRETGGHEDAKIPEWLDIISSLSPQSRSITRIPFPPFKWDEDRRARLKAELDAYYARLYGLADEELRYILEPQDVYGPDFPGETFRVLKEKEIRKYGEYRTKRLILEAWKSGKEIWMDKRIRKRLFKCNVCGYPHRK